MKFDIRSGGSLRIAKFPAYLNHTFHGELIIEEPIDQELLVKKFYVPEENKVLNAEQAFKEISNIKLQNLYCGVDPRFSLADLMLLKRLFGNLLFLTGKETLRRDAYDLNRRGETNSFSIAELYRLFWLRHGVFYDVIDVELFHQEIKDAVILENAIQISKGTEGTEVWCETRNSHVTHDYCVLKNEFATYFNLKKNTFQTN